MTYQIFFYSLIVACLIVTGLIWFLQMRQEKAQRRYEEQRRAQLVREEQNFLKLASKTMDYFHHKKTP